MKIEISKNMNTPLTQEDLRNAEIVQQGDYVLMPKHNLQVIGHKKNEIYIISIEDILFVESFGDEVVFHVDKDTYGTDMTLHEFQQISEKLIRINKSTLVNRSRIVKIRPALNMKYQVYLKDRWLDVNRTYYYLFEEEMGL